jgi:hypothetical protein
VLRFTAEDVVALAADCWLLSSRKAPVASETIAANLDALSCDEKRLALDALGVKVRVYKQGSHDADGNPYPRWEMTLSPAATGEQVVYATTRSP